MTMFVLIAGAVQIVFYDYDYDPGVPHLFS